MPDITVRNRLFDDRLFELINALGSDLREPIIQELGILVANEYTGKFHGRHGTYIKGCRGPMCTFAKRMEGRVQQTSQPRPAMLALDRQILPIIAAYEDFQKTEKELAGIEKQTDKALAKVERAIKRAESADPVT